MGTAARCRIVFGEQGLTVFSELWIANTVLCAALSIVAARRLSSASKALPAGLLLVTAGLSLSFGPGGSKAALFAGMLALTAGEIVFNALAGLVLVLVRLAPPGLRQGSAYGGAVFVQFAGRIAGGSLAFPLVVATAHPLPIVWLAATILLALCWVTRHDLQRLTRDG